MRTKIMKADDESIVFDNGYQLYSTHERECCEFHYLDTTQVDMDEVKDLEFNLEGTSFYRPVAGYGIELLPLNGHPVRVPGYGHNNG